MITNRSFYLVLFLLFAFNAGRAQVAAPQRPWNARWIAAGNDDGTQYGVYYFRKTITLDRQPRSFTVHLSADNQYKLYVNDSLVSAGPARGDLGNWYYETLDLSPYLKAGKNIIAAMVYNEAQFRPEAQVTLRTAFILQGASASEEVLNTGKTWKCTRDAAFMPVPGFYFAASKGQLVDMNKIISGWTTIQYDDHKWEAAAELFEGKPKGQSDGFAWMLIPSDIPARERSYQRIPALRNAQGVTASKNFPAVKSDQVIPAHSTAVFLLDQSFLTNAYLTLIFSGGKNAGISISYAESLFDNIAKNGMRKSNRNEVTGKDFSGRKDSILSNGTNGQVFTPLNFRTFRYIQLLVRTEAEPLVINDIYGLFTGYPFKQHATFNSSNNDFQKLLDIGWRTCRLNAYDTYTDCPYYEQLQYIGDTRIQAMVSYYYSGDDRLARHALNLIDNSRLPEGVTLSRYPTHSTQIISTFSLWYIGMLHDYWYYRDDSIFVKNKLAGTRAILDFFSKYQSTDGSLTNTPYWTFVDWANGKDWFVGAPPRGHDGSSSIIDMQLLWAYQWAMEMEAQLGAKYYADLYQQKAARLTAAIKARYWDAGKGLFADTKDKKHFSQHANALALLTGIAEKKDIPSICDQLLHNDTLTQCTIYFKYYLHMALVKGGQGNDYLNWLDVWYNNIKMGLTTWAEVSDLSTTRSDCHAWGSSPNIEFFRTILGIDSDGPGFNKIKIQPHLGDLKHVSGEIPHPKGKIKASYQLAGNKWTITITIPPGTSGSFIWNGKTYALNKETTKLQLDQ
ncbi:alpha-L-rhamnosidase C-terminal domain-containing protein [Niabella beijingensis]|uniref:alpha-L-rhamnosidase-related protein n=1 Tax=Niabella beijingensis TaxID=2872700 RepID=UPI001CBB3FF9|nr:alpha-L-rhamnosidase C-terminal domain-containing protein [Niabella beijingensis]MBZ4191347.1 alpha-L-rhamnosidase N-terminal domain-containing protein [Niabella beijingensis]